MTNFSKTVAKVSIAIFITIICTRPANSQKIFLVQKNYVYHNMGTGSTTSDWSHYFLIEGEKTFRKAGYFGQHLKKFAQSDSQAVKYINSYATRQVFRLTTTVSTVVLFSAFAISNLSKERVSQNNLDAPDKNKELLYASIGTLAVNILLRAIPPKSIRKAVNSYNNSIKKKTTGFNSIFINPQQILNKQNFAIGLRFSI